MPVWVLERDGGVRQAPSGSSHRAGQFARRESSTSPRVEAARTELGGQMLSLLQRQPAGCSGGFD